MKDIEDIGKIYNLHRQSYHTFDNLDEINGIRSRMLKWFRTHKRKLPWRGDIYTLQEQTSKPLKTQKVKKKVKKSGLTTFKNKLKQSKIKLSHVGNNGYIDLTVDDSDDEKKKKVKDEHKINESKESKQPKIFSAKDDNLEETEQIQRVTPYETWVSEVMLQQTRVETVCDYLRACCQSLGRTNIHEQ